MGDFSYGRDTLARWDLISCEPTMAHDWQDRGNYQECRRCCKTRYAEFATHHRTCALRQGDTVCTCVK